jgi:two-component system CheB/CheR fusion protein
MDLAKNKDKLFIPFKRFREDIPGLGIGLHIIKTLIEKNGGKITAESEPGEGTEFSVYLKEY